MDTSALGERIRKLRKDKGISLRELARRAEISPSFLSEVETGRSFPSPESLERIAAKLEVSLVSLRKLDGRSKISELKLLLEKDPAWGPAFQIFAKAARNGKIDPEKFLKDLGLK